MERKKVVKENAERLAKINGEYQPHTGKGSYGERRIIHLPDSPIPLQYIPIEMEQVELVSLLRKFGSIDKFIKILFSSNINSLSLPTILKYSPE